MKVEAFLKDAQIYTSKERAEQPIISVIMPTYCKGDNGLLERSIHSVLHQSFKAFELIIVDDGSIDATQQVVLKKIEQDPRIVYIRNKINTNIPAIRVNQGMRIAKGTYIAYQFDDDTWVEDGLETLYETISKKDHLCVVYGQSECHMPNSDLVRICGTQVR